MSYHGLGASFPDFNPAVDSAIRVIRKTKVALGKAQTAADKYQLRKEHWDKLSSAEQKFQKTLQLMDKIAPEHVRGISKKIGGQVGQLALLAALALIGSTLLLHVWVSSKRAKEEEEEEEVEEVETEPVVVVVTD